MRLIRQWHLYLGVLFAPLIIFFAFSGALQTLGLHEARDGQKNHHPAWIARLADVHKDQRLPGAAAAPSGPEGEAPRRKPSWPFKWCVVVMSMGLIMTTGLGLYMAFQFARPTRWVWWALLLGIGAPLLLLFL